MAFYEHVNACTYPLYAAMARASGLARDVSLLSFLVEAAGDPSLFYATENTPSFPPGCKNPQHFPLLAKPFPPFFTMPGHDRTIRRHKVRLTFFSPSGYRPSSTINEYSSHIRRLRQRFPSSLADFFPLSGHSERGNLLSFSYGRCMWSGGPMVRRSIFLLYSWRIVFFFSLAARNLFFFSRRDGPRSIRQALYLFLLRRDGEPFFFFLSFLPREEDFCFFCYHGGVSHRLKNKNLRPCKGLSSPPSEASIKREDDFPYEYLRQDSYSPSLLFIAFSASTPAVSPRPIRAF